LSDIVYYTALWATERYNIAPAIAAIKTRKRETEKKKLLKKK